MDSYYVHRSEGVLIWDYGIGQKWHEPWWCLLKCDQGIVDFYSWLCKKAGLPVMKNTLHGAHVSVVKGEEPLVKEAWGVNFGPVEFYYASIIRYDNDRHAWLDVNSQCLHELRSNLGLPPKINMSYHMTLGRLI